VIARLRRRGVIILGKANMSEWANIAAPHVIAAGPHRRVVRNPIRSTVRLWLKFR